MFNLELATLRLTDANFLLQVRKRGTKREGKGRTAAEGEMYIERPVDIVALRSRQRLYDMQKEQELYTRLKNEASRSLRLQINASQLTELMIEERIHRESAEVSERDGRLTILALLQLVHDDIAKKDLARALAKEKCDTTFQRKIDAVLSADEELEERNRRIGKERLVAERKRMQEDVAAREAILAQRRKQEDQLLALRAFIIGDETRQRHYLCENEAKVLRILQEHQAHDYETSKALEYDRFMNSDEQKLLAAERERKAQEERAAASKKENDFKREQQKLVTKCTHSRAGGSVFVGPLAKKMCLICKVKFDEAQGIYIKMP